MARSTPLRIVPKERIDLGLAIAHATQQPGQRRTLQEIAAYCDCRPGTIWMIESRALRKLKRKLFLRRDKVLTELIER